MLIGTSTYRLARGWEREGRAVLFGDPSNGDVRFFRARGLSGGSRGVPRLPLSPIVNHGGPSTTRAIAIAALLPTAPATESTFSDLPGLPALPACELGVPRASARKQKAAAAAPAAPRPKRGRRDPAAAEEAVAQLLAAAAATQQQEAEKKAAAELALAARR